MFRFDIATKSSKYTQQLPKAMSLVYESYLFILSKGFGNQSNDYRSFLSCGLSILPFEWTWGWGWPCFDTNLLLFNGNFAEKIIISITTTWLYQNKVNSSIVCTGRFQTTIVFGWKNNRDGDITMPISLKTIGSAGYRHQWNKRFGWVQVNRVCTCNVL